MDVVMRVQEVRTNGEDEPCHPVLVADCGEIKLTA